MIRNYDSHSSVLIFSVKKGILQDIKDTLKQMKETMTKTIL
jgi:hypothetical protein